MALDTLNCSGNVTTNWTATKNGPSAAYGPTSTPTTLANVTRYTLGATAGKVNNIYSNIVSIAGGGSATLNLMSLTNVILQPLTFTAIKLYCFELLDATQDAVNGTACSSVTIGGAAANPNNLDMGGTNPTRTINNGGVALMADKTAGGIAVNVGSQNVKITNNDGARSASVRVTFFGIG